MHSQRSCPICRSEDVRRVLRDVRFLADLGGEVHPLDSVTSYRCPNGHVFMILPSSVEPASDAPSTLSLLTESLAVRK